jgi:hypothetical protein
MYRLCPGEAFVLKNDIPATHDSGNSVPIGHGRDDSWFPKSTAFDCVDKCTRVWPQPSPALRHTTIQHLFLIIVLFAFYTARQAVLLLPF